MFLEMLLIFFIGELLILTSRLTTFELKFLQSIPNIKTYISIDVKLFFAFGCASFKLCISLWFQIMKTCVTAKALATFDTNNGWQFYQACAEAASVPFDQFVFVTVHVHAVGL